MSPSLLVMPEPGPMRAPFDYAHYQDHLAIAQAVKTQKGITLPVYPVSGNNWLQTHQRMHDDMNNALNLGRFDLLTLRDDDENARRGWAWLNYQQHLAAHRALKLP
jgi:hypothetical protein